MSKSRATNPPKHRTRANTCGDAKRRARYKTYFGCIALGTTPLGVVLTLASSHRFERLPVTLQWSFVFLSSVSTLYLLGLFLLPWTRPLWLKQMSFDPHHWWTSVLALLNTAYIALIITCGFGVVTAFLYLRGMASTTSAIPLADPFNDCNLYYVWNFLNAIPALEIPKTLGWELHFSFTDRANLVLLLCYKLALVGPLVATGKILWRAVKRREAQQGLARATPTDDKPT